MDDLRNRQQGQAPALDRTPTNAPRTPVPFPFQDPRSPGVAGAEDDARQKLIASGMKNQDADLKNVASRELAYEQEQQEKNRQRGRASTFGTSGYGDTSTAKTGRATLYGY